ncbi:MAG: hypothetical protein ABFS86_04270 [Planctomycetota bacterium]
MRNGLILTFLVLAAVVASAQGTSPTPWENSQYRVKATVPAGWTSTLKEPKARGSWIELGAFAESRSEGKMSLSVQASRFRDADEMIRWQREQFEKDAGLAVLRDEVRPGSRTRPKGVLFEYTYQHGGKPRHAVAVYWLHRDRRYRVYAAVREVGWKTIAGDVRAFVKSVGFTSRAYAKSPQNFTDEPMNFRLYYPEGWTIKLPVSGPRVMFTSEKQGVRVWVYADESAGTLKKDWGLLLSGLEEGDAKVLTKKNPERHPDLGVEVGIVEYTKQKGTALVRYRESCLTHRGRFYRIVLAAASTAFKSGLSDYERMVKSISFMK